MESIYLPALQTYLLALGDDELILGHRDSEWCGHAPIIEEDIAFANLALDELGHAGLWYSLLASQSEQDPATYPDWLAFQRDPADFRNAQMLELPKGDWAFTTLRQYLFDALELARLPRLALSRHPGLAEVATKIHKEELYHLRHSRAWVKRLGLGTEESNTRMQRALDELWPYTAQFFTPLPGELELAQQGIAPYPEQTLADWQAQVLPLLQESGLIVPADQPALTSPRSDHTPQLTLLLAEMQSVARLEPDAEW